MQDGIRDVRRFFQTYELCRIIRGRAPRGAGNPSPASELVLGVKREDATARFLRGGFPYGLSRGIPCSAYTAKYPIPASRLPALRLSTQSDRNVRNALGNIVRTKRGKIVPRYSETSGHW